MRVIVAAFLGLCLLCLPSGCGGGGSNKIERPAHPVPVAKDAKLSSAHAGGGAPAPAPNSAPAPTGQKQP
jgi:hypothetical protein